MSDVVGALLVKVAIFLIVFSLGTNVRPGDLRYLVERPRKLLRSALAIYLITPAFAVLLVKAIAMPKALGLSCSCSRSLPVRR